jgi:hypothetical protein
VRFPRYSYVMHMYADVAGALGTWRDHVAMLVSNRTKGWSVAVGSIGDALLNQGHVADAHFWYARNNEDDRRTASSRENIKCWSWAMHAVFCCE